MSDKNVKPSKLLWLDLEMTGLEPSKDVIIETACIVTDFQFNILATHEAVIHQPANNLKSINPWSLEQHTKSGLLDKVKNSGRPEAEVINETASLIKNQFGEEPAILAGNSIYNDRKFIEQWWPEVNKLLHYRMLDVSSLKVYMQGRYGIEYKKREAHRALDDIKESIAELEYYLSWLRDNQ